MHSRTLPALACSVLAGALAAQAPQYHAIPALKPGESLDTVLIGTGGQPFASLVDVTGGPVTVAGETFYLGFTSAVTTLDAGILPPGGLRFLRLATPGAGLPLGLPLHLQSVVLDPGAPNGAFRASDGESSVFYGSTAVIVENFLDPAAAGVTGSFDPSARGRLQGAPVQRRTHQVAPPGATPFSFGVLGALNPHGVRAQMVYRAADIGASGQPELLVGIHWRPFGQVTTDDFQRLVIDVVHSQVVPDYTIDPFSALPRFPSSGLSTTFASNIKANETPVRAFDGAYAIRPANLRPDGYLPYPALQQPFAYNGIDSLLLDFKTMADPNAVGLNGAFVYLMVLTSPLPNSRALDSGSAGLPVNPFQSTVANMASNTLHDVQLEFARVESTALSPWRQAPVPNPDYHTPSIAASVPPGASAVVEYRGADDPSGTGATIWTQNIDLADGKAFLQWRVTFTADVGSGAVPSIDAIVIPVN